MRNEGPLGDLLDEMDVVVERYRQAGDRNGYFAAMYRSVTREISHRCAAGEFEDADRMAAFAGAFARRYLDAVEARHRGTPTTTSWTAAFDQGRRWRPLVLQHLMLGMNAHINFDLGVVTADFADRDGLDAMATDFRRINDVLGTMVDSCQQLVGQASPWLGLLDRLGGRTDTRIVRFSLISARDAAWHSAERLHRLGPAERADAVQALDREVARLARLVLDGPVLVDSAAFVVRLRETRSVGSVIELLSTAAPRSG